MLQKSLIQCVQCVLASLLFIGSPAQLSQGQATELDDSKSEESALAPLDTQLFNSLKLRSIGPAFMSGRIGDIAVDQSQPNTWYIAVASGNVFKTTNAGTTFEPIFEDYPSYSIGCITIDPSNSNTIWIGTGENNGGRHIGFGDGIYVSHDAGKSFDNCGLGASEHLSKILVDPRNSNVVFAASQGALVVARGRTRTVQIN